MEESENGAQQRGMNAAPGHHPGGYPAYLADLAQPTPYQDNSGHMMSEQDIQ